MLFDGGLGNLSFASNRLEDNEAVVATNVDLRIAEGSLHAKKGNLIVKKYRKRIDSFHAFLGKLLVHSKGNLYYNTLNIISRPFSSSNPMSAVSYEGNIYITNGVEFLRFDGFDYVTPFVSAPSISGVAAAEGAAGRLVAGEYLYKFTYRRNFNQSLSGDARDESPPTTTELSVTITANKTIDLSDLPNQLGYNLVIYRWQIGMGSEFREVAELEAAETDYMDNLTYWQLTNILTTSKYITPPIPKILTRHKHNLFICGISVWDSEPLSRLDNYVLVSDDRRFSGWDPANLFIISRVDDTVLNMKVLGDNLYIYTKANIFRIVGDNVDTYRLQATEAFTGLATEQALVDTLTYGHLLLGSDRRLHLFGGSSFIASPDLRKVDAIFAKRSTYADKINWARRDTCRLSFFNQMAYLAYPSGSSSEPDRVLNIDFKNYPKLRFTVDKYEITCWHADQINNLLYSGNTTGHIKAIEDGSDYLVPQYKTKDFDAGDIHAEKEFAALRSDYTSQGKSIAVIPTIDGVAKPTITLNKATRNTTELRKTVSNPNAGKRISFEFGWAEPSVDVAIHDFDIDLTKNKRMV